MKTVVLRIGALVAALTFAAPAAAQPSQPSQPSQGRVGIGLGLPTHSFGSLLSTAGTATGMFEGPQIYVPINVSPNLRIEPQFGYFSNTDDEVDETDSAFTLGAGVFYVAPVSERTNIYAGGRLAFTWTKDEDHAGTTFTKTTQRNTSIAPVFGGEYSPSPRFSVGAEAQLNFVWLGDPKFEAAGTSVTGQGGSNTFTQGLMFIRVYFL